MSSGEAPIPAGRSVFTKHNWDMGMGYLWLNGWGIYHLMGGALWFNGWGTYGLNGWGSYDSLIYFLRFILFEEPSSWLAFKVL